MNPVVYLLLILFIFFAKSGTSIAADSWTLWQKTDLLILETSDKKALVDTYWDIAGKTKESSSFSSKALCESARHSTIAKFRATQGEKTLPDKKITLRVRGEIVSLISQYNDGKGNSEQNIELSCRNEDPPKRERH
jgi:hypothetical protein